MRAETKKLLAKLAAHEWFQEIGKPLASGLKDKAFLAKSLADAITYCGSIEWENYRNEMKNSLTMYLHQHFMPRYRPWNELVDAIDVELVPMVEKKLAAAADRLGEFKDHADLKQSVTYTMRMACMELEYSDLRDPAFFGGLMDWYFAGRLPCGWGETDKDGKMQLLAPLEEGRSDFSKVDMAKYVLAYQDSVYNPRVHMPCVGRLIVY